MIQKTKKVKAANPGFFDPESGLHSSWRGKASASSVTLRKKFWLSSTMGFVTETLLTQRGLWVWLRGDER